MHVKLLVIVTAALAVANAFPNQQLHSEKLAKRSEHIKASNIEEATFSVRLDHSRAQDVRTVEFTYNYNLESYEYGGPVFLYLKDGEDTSTRWIEQGLMVDIARQNAGGLFTFDMRYFGANLPTENASFENLQFLTPEQILHDVAELITIIQERHAAFFSPVILWGSGYGATIAAWARKKYPHLVDGVWASSGIYYIEPMSFNKYDSIGYALHNGNDFYCRNNMLQALESIEELLVEGNGAAVQEHFNLCHPVDTTNENDMSFFYEALIEFIIDYLNQFHLTGLNNVCSDLLVIEGNRLASLARWFNYVRTTGECIDWSYESFVSTSGNTEWNQPGTQSGRRQWAYLQCTQAALFQITDQYTWFPNRIELPYRIDQCEDILGEEYVHDHLELAMRGMRNSFGSYNQRVTNIIYTNGYLDPMRYNGITYTFDNTSIALNIEHVAKSADLTSMQGSDPHSLSQAKQVIVDRITEWVDVWRILKAKTITRTERN